MGIGALSRRNVSIIYSTVIVKLLIRAAFMPNSLDAYKSTPLTLWVTSRIELRRSARKVIWFNLFKIKKIKNHQNLTLSDIGGKWCILRCSDFEVDGSFHILLKKKKQFRQSLVKVRFANLQVGISALHNAHAISLPRFLNRKIAKKRQRPNMVPHSLMLLFSFWALW